MSKGNSVVTYNAAAGMLRVASAALQFPKQCPRHVRNSDVIYDNRPSLKKRIVYSLWGCLYLIALKDVPVLESRLFCRTIMAVSRHLYCNVRDGFVAEFCHGQRCPAAETLNAGAHRKTAEVTNGFSRILFLSMVEI